MFNKSLLFTFSRYLRKSKAKFSDVTAIKDLFLEEKKYCLEDMPYKDPFKIFQTWYQETRDSADIMNPNIMCLATATPNGIPSLRYMLCDAHDDKGFTFFTHHTTRKGEELKKNPLAAIGFFWAPFLRTVRVEGYVEKLSDEACNKLFAKRSYECQINMHCSSQSKRLSSYNAFKEKEREIRRMFDPAAIPRPENFGWYELIPTTFEFWQLKQKKERMRFRKALPEEILDELTHKGEKGWLYEIMEP